MLPRRIAWLALPLAATACDPPPPPPARATASTANDPAYVRMPVFSDRTKQVPFERGRARLLSIRSALLSPTLGTAQTTELGFECATLRAERKKLTGEEDPLVARFVADADRTCGMDVPLAAAYVELHAIEAKRLSHEGVKSECFGLKVAVRDFAAPYVQNPTVVEVSRKFAEWCNLEGVQ